MTAMTALQHLSDNPRFRAIYLLAKIKILSMAYGRVKGVSPLVASVLLIAATMSIAAILAYWASSFVRTSLPEVNKTQQECQFSDFTIYQCSYKNSTTGSGDLTLVLNNIRSVPLQNLAAFIFDQNGTPGNAIPLNQTVDPGSFQPFIISNVSSTFSKVIITSKVCPDLQKETACSRS